MKFTYLIEAWKTEESQSAVLYWKGRGEDAFTVTKDPFEALQVDQPAVAHQLIDLLDKSEPVAIHGIQGKWIAVLHGFDKPAVHEPYPSEDQIVDHLFEGMNEEDAGKLVQMGQDGDLGMLHHGFGTWIRNTYNLWRADNPHTMKDYVPEIRNGADCSPRHPDQTSMRIIEKLYAKVAAARSA